MANNHHHCHFLVVTFGFTGHLNPARNFARRLTRPPFCIPVTITTPTSTGAHKNVEEEGGLLSYSHYSDGNEEGIYPTPEDLPRIKLRMKESISSLILGLAAQGRPVTFIVYSMLLTVAADVANELGIPSALLWIQPAALFTIYHRYFHGYGDLIAAHEDDPMFTVELPGLPSLKIRDLPSFLTVHRSESSPYSILHLMYEDMFWTLDRILVGHEASYCVLINTFQELEPGLVSGVDGMEFIPVGPLVAVESEEISDGYMEWLDSKDEGSVVYISFGSVAVLSVRQMEEVAKGLVESGRPYLWVLRKDNRKGYEEVGVEGGERGMVVEWCSQMKVLAHRSVGCFVTHCGWSSTLEGLVCEVPMVMVPQWADQATNARLAEEELGVGVRAEVMGEEGVVEGKELRRCVEIVMGTEGEEMRKRLKILGEKGRETVGEGGSSFGNIETFVERSIRSKVRHLKPFV